EWVIVCAVNRCEVHDLAAGPDGRCVFCRRDSGPAPASTRRWAAGLVFAFAAIGALTAVGWRWKHRPRGPEPTAEIEAQAEGPSDQAPERAAARSRRAPRAAATTAAARAGPSASAHDAKEESAPVLDARRPIDAKQKPSGAQSEEAEQREAL